MSFVDSISGTMGQSWIISADIVNEDFATKYVTALYWSIATMVGVGYGDVRAENTAERIYSIIAQIMGASIFGYIIGNITQLM